MKSALKIASLIGLALLAVVVHAALVTPPTVDWVSVPSTASVGQSVSVGVGAHANLSDNSDGNNWNSGTMATIARVMVDLTRPDGTVTRIYDWLPTWQSPATIWTSFTVNQAGTYYISVQLMDGRPWYSGVLTYAIGVPNPAPSITSQLTMNVNQGFNTSYQITATNSPTSYGLTGLPPGPASFNPSNGAITLQPTTGGAYSSTISATNAYGTDTKPLTWNVTAAVISPASSISPSATSVGVPVTLTRAGYANFGIGWFGSIMWKPDGSGDYLGNQQAGSQSYTPTAAGSYIWQVWLYDSSGNNNVVQSISLTVSGIPAPSNFQAASVLSYSVAFSWNAVPGAAGYNVYRNGTKLNSTAISSTAFTDSSAAPSTGYTYSVRAIATDGSESPSSSLNITTAGSFVVFTPLN